MLTSREQTPVKKCGTTAIHFGKTVLLEYFSVSYKNNIRTQRQRKVIKLGEASWQTKIISMVKDEYPMDHSQS